MGSTAGIRPARRCWRWELGWLVLALWGLAVIGLAMTWWLDHLLRQAGRPELVLLDARGVPYVLAILSAATVGAVLASRRPGHPVGWLLLALGLAVAVTGFAEGYARYGVLARPGGLPAAGYVAQYSPAAILSALASIGLVLLLTPTGSLPTPRWRSWARLTAAPPVVFVGAMLLLAAPPVRQVHEVDDPRGLHALGGAGQVANWVSAVSVITVLVAVGSLVGRFRRAHGLERQQLRWVALATGAVSPAVVAVLAAMAAGSVALFAWALGVCVAVLPLAIGAAVLRYRLYDLDRIISRTLAYGLLTVLLGGGYAGVVLGLSQLLGRDSPLVVAGATLAVAAAFQPARRRIQAVVDRRFNRRRYNAARTIAAFSARLRQQVDLDTLTAELLGVVEQTMQPASASLWLRPSASASPDQRGTGASRAALQAAASPFVRTGL
jgi:hypothetical protein